jgi:Protein of unknown function (DUF3574)
MQRLALRFLTVILTVVTLIGVSAYMSVPVDAQDSVANAGRTALVFGTAKPDGTAVTDAEFGAFLDVEVSSRFPNGVTTVKGANQFRSAGVLVKETSFVVTFLYPLDRARDASRRINEVRQLYNLQFQQSSVLRVDDAFGVRVSF